MPVEPKSKITAWLHLVAAHILVVEVLQPTAEFLLVFLVGNRGGQLGGFQHGVVDENRAVQAQGQRQGVARAGIHADEFAVPLQPDQGVEGFLFQLVDDDFAHACVESQQEALDEVVGHGPRSGDLFDLQGYGVGLIDAHPDGKDRIAADVLQDHDGHVGDGVHHQAANFHFDFHKTLQAYYTTFAALSPASELGPERVTRTCRYWPSRDAPSASGCVKFSVRFCEVRPIHWPSASWRPSTSTSSTPPINSVLRRICMARCFSLRIMRRRVFSSSGTLSSIPSAAVLGRREYLKLKSESYCTSSSSWRVCSKSASVSPGKPTMMSVVSAMLRRAPLIHAMRCIY